MPSYRMRVHLDYPTFDNLSEDRKSLINFIMEHGAAFFRGEYDGNTLLHMAGAVRPTTRVIANGYYNTESGGYDVNIMYTQVVYTVSFTNSEDVDVTVTLKDSVEDKANHYLKIENDENYGVWTLYHNNEVVVTSNHSNIADILDDMSDYIDIYPATGDPTTQDVAGLVKTQFTTVSQTGNPFDPSILPDHGASIPHIDGSEDSINSLHYEDGIIDCNTVLREAHAQLTLYYCEFVEVTGYWPGAVVVEDDNHNPLLQIPVTLLPKIGDVINTNSKIKPTFIVQKGTSKDGLHVCEMDIDKEDMDFIYDQQLRTEHFWLQYLDYDSVSHFDKVFYKMGIVTLNSTYTMNTIIENLKSKTLEIERLTQTWHPVDYEEGDTDPSCARFSLDSDGSDDYVLNSTGYAWIEQRLGSKNAGGIAKAFVCGVTDETDNHTPVCLIYFKLYKDTGTAIVPFTEVIDHSEFSLHNDDDPEGESVTTLSLEITDQNMNGGYVESSSSSPVINPVNPNPVDPSTL